MKDKILIVDDLITNRVMLASMLEDDYDILEAADGQEAIEILSEAQGEEMPTAILLDIMMPGIDGFGVLKHIRSKETLRNIPVLFITAANDEETEIRGLREGAKDYIRKPFTYDIVKLRVGNAIALFNYQTKLEKMVEKTTQELVAKNERMLESLASIIEYRSLESGEHIRRTAELTKIIISYMLEKPIFAQELFELDYKTIINASKLHDIGKIGIPDEILLKPGKLTAKEYEIVKEHTTIGYNILESIKFDDDDAYIKHCKDICRYHHERWDGKGYPDGLAGDKIPLSARIVAVVDVYDALVSVRCYKPEFSLEKTYEIFRESSGTQFQSEIVDCLFEAKDELYELEQRMKDSS